LGGLDQLLALSTFAELVADPGLEVLAFLNKLKDGIRRALLKQEVESKYIG
jgi:hypothetical protein